MCPAAALKIVRNVGPASCRSSLADRLEAYPQPECDHLVFPPRGDRRVLGPEIARPVDRHAVRLPPEFQYADARGPRTVFRSKHQDLLEVQDRIGQQQPALESDHRPGQVDGLAELSARPLRNIFSNSGSCCS